MKSFMLALTIFAFPWMGCIQYVQQSIGAGYIGSTLVPATEDPDSQTYIESSKSIEDCFLEAVNYYNYAIFNSDLTSLSNAVTQQTYKLINEYSQKAMELSQGSLNSDATQYLSYLRKNGIYYALNDIIIGQRKAKLAKCNEWGIISETTIVFIYEYGVWKMDLSDQFEDSIASLNQEMVKKKATPEKETLLSATTTSAPSKKDQAASSSGNTEAPSPKVNEKVNACGAGDAASCFSAAFMFRKGEGVIPNPVLARYYFNESCKMDLAVACTTLGTMMEKGEGGDADINAALMLYNRGCELNDAKGCYSLAVLMDGDLITNENVDGYPAPKDTMKKACDMGMQEACSHPILKDQ